MHTNTMSVQLLLNATNQPLNRENKHHTLLPLFTNTHQIEKELLSKLNKDLFSSNNNNNNNNNNDNHLLSINTGKSFPTYQRASLIGVKKSEQNQNQNQNQTLTHTPMTPFPSPPRTPVLMEQRGSISSPSRSFMITPPPETTMSSTAATTTNESNKEIMTIASKIPLFRKRKNTYSNKDNINVKGPVILKLCNINYPQREIPTHLPNNNNNTNTATTTIPISIPSTKTRKFRCKTCSMAFTTSGHLSRHNKIHTGEKNFVCPHDDCNQKFSRHDNCLQHYRTHLKKGKVQKKRK